MSAVWGWPRGQGLGAIGHLSLTLKEARRDAAGSAGDPSQKERFLQKKKDKEVIMQEKATAHLSPVRLRVHHVSSAHYQRRV